MSWLRIDDGFVEHPKFRGWTDRQRWAWLSVLTYCARYDTIGVIPNDLNLLPRIVTKSVLEKAEASGLIDRSDTGEMLVHDWLIYNGQTVAEKVAYYLTKHPDASANEVQRGIGGKREVVLAEVQRFLSTRESGSTEPPLAQFPGTTFNGSETGSRAPAPPTPTPTPEVQEQKQTPPNPTATSNAADAHYLAPLDYLGELEQARTGSAQ